MDIFQIYKRYNIISIWENFFYKKFFVHAHFFLAINRQTRRLLPQLRLNELAQNFKLNFLLKCMKLFYVHIWLTLHSWFKCRSWLNIINFDINSKILNIFDGITFKRLKICKFFQKYHKEGLICKIIIKKYLFSAQILSAINRQTWSLLLQLKLNELVKNFKKNFLLKCMNFIFLHIW